MLWMGVPDFQRLLISLLASCTQKCRPFGPLKVYEEGSSIFGRLKSAAEEGEMELLFHNSIVLRHNS